MPRLVPLAQLVEEGFAASPSELFMAAVDRGWALGIDAGGQVGVRGPVADRLRQERREAEARAAREQELARRQAQDAEVAALVAQERQQQVRDREARLVAAIGPLWQIDAEMRREEWLRPDTGGSLTARDRIADASYTLEDYEAYAADRYGYGQDVLAS